MAFQNAQNAQNRNKLFARRNNQNHTFPLWPSREQKKIQQDVDVVFNIQSHYVQPDQNDLFHSV